MAGGNRRDKLQVTWRDAESRPKEKKDSDSDVMKCPFCGRELQEGYLTAPRGLHCDIKEHKIQWPLKNIHTLRCPECDVFMFRGPPLKKCAMCGCDIPTDEEECESCGAPQQDRW